MIAFFEDVLNLPYASNSDGSSKNKKKAHEKQIKDLLVKHKLEHVEQPNGSQQSPDFFVF